MKKNMKPKTRTASRHTTLPASQQPVHKSEVPRN